MHSLIVGPSKFVYTNGQPVQGYNETFSDANIYAKGGRIYIYHDYNETVVDSNGSILWSVDNVAAPASVDESGFVYTVPAMEPGEEYSQQLLDEHIHGTIH